MWYPVKGVSFYLNALKSDMKDGDTGLLLFLKLHTFVGRLFTAKSVACRLANFSSRVLYTFIFIIILIFIFMITP